MSEPMVPLRKAQAGGDSFGNTWDKDGAVVDVPQWQAVELLGIPGGGFEVADEKAAAKAAEQAEAEAPPPDAPWEPAPVGDAPAPGVDERVVDGTLNRQVEQMPGRPIAKPAPPKARAGARTQSKTGGQ